MKPASQWHPTFLSILSAAGKPSLVTICEYRKQSHQHILFLLFIVPHLLNPFWAQGTMAGSLLKAVRDKEGIILRTASSEDGGLGKRRMCMSYIMSSVVSVCSRIILGWKMPWPILLRTISVKKSWSLWNSMGQPVKALIVNHVVKSVIYTQGPVLPLRS